LSWDTQFLFCPCDKVFCLAHKNTRHKKDYKNYSPSPRSLALYFPLRNTTPEGGRAQRTISDHWSPLVCWRFVQTIFQKAPSTIFFSPIFFALLPLSFHVFSHPHFILIKDSRQDSIQLETTFDDHMTFFFRF
jgi:hypothetical protein